MVLWLTLAAATAEVALALLGRVAPLFAAEWMLPVILMIAIGVGVPASGVFAGPVLAASTGRREVALTFDDGPDPRWTPPLLDLLDAHAQRATFFVIGDRAARHPELLCEIVRRGHEIANHTWSHSYLTAFRSAKELAIELERANALVANTTGVRPRWFRPPVGVLSPPIPVASEMAGLRLVSWTASARDGVHRTTVGQAFARLERALRPGAILVLHDARLDGSTEPIACKVVDMLLTRMAALGLRSVTLSQLVSVAGDPRDSAVKADASTEH
jgi:peptidoglycan/xylan/chitin deacetylase (PgdA/CDA1 family)